MIYSQLSYYPLHTKSSSLRLECLVFCYIWQSLICKFIAVCYGHSAVISILEASFFWACIAASSIGSNLFPEDKSNRLCPPRWCVKGGGRLQALSTTLHVLFKMNGAHAARAAVCGSVGWLVIVRVLISSPNLRPCFYKMAKWASLHGHVAAFRCAHVRPSYHHCPSNARGRKITQHCLGPF